MTFDTNWANVQNRETNFPPEEDGTVNPVLNSIVWSSLATGIGEITESNWEEAWVRIDLWQTLIGSWFYRIVDDKREPILVTKQDVKNAIGAHTNASRKTRSEFIKGLILTRYL